MHACASTSSSHTVHTCVTPSKCHAPQVKHAKISLGMEKVGYEARVSKKNAGPQGFQFNDARSMAPSTITARTGKTAKRGGSVWTAVNDIVSEHQYL